MRIKWIAVALNLTTGAVTACTTKHVWSIRPILAFFFAREADMLTVADTYELLWRVDHNGYLFITRTLSGKVVTAEEIRCNRWQRAALIEEIERRGGKQEQQPAGQSATH